MTDKQSPAKLNPPVFYSAAGLITLIIIFAATVPDIASRWFDAVQSAIIINASWFYVLAVAIILLSVVYLGFSRMGTIKLGPDHSEPDYSRISWFAMLFSAGMGIGLMFFGVAEPVMHFLAPPVAEPGSVDAAREAMKITFFHRFAGCISGPWLCHRWC